MISGEMRSVTGGRGFFSRDVWPFLLLFPSAVFFSFLLTISVSLFCHFGLFGLLFLCFSCCLLAFEDCFFAKDVRVLLLEMREDVGASPDNDLMTSPCFSLLWFLAIKALQTVHWMGCVVR
ncbi:hypothetical protein V8C34DRAFT_223399 [Trichoderma compactum]